MEFGYISLYDNELNSVSQIRRAVDMAYQRGASFKVVLTGDTYISSMELDVDLYVNNSVVGKMNIVPATITQSGYTYYYTFNIRPYNFLQSFIESEHYKYYWLNDWYTTTQDINVNRDHTNSITFSMKYGYRYVIGNVTTTEYITSPTNDYNHYTMIPFSAVATGFTASGFTSTGGNFDLIGGAFQMDEKFILPNFDQEVGSTIGTNLQINTLDVFRRYSPMCQFLFDYPSVPEMSETSRFLTDAPRIQNIQNDENYVLYYLNGQTGDRQVIEADFAVFEFYDDDNNLVLYFEQELNFDGTSYESPEDYTDNLKIFALPVGPKDIENIYQTVTWSGISHYRVQIFYGLPTDDANRSTVGAIGPVSETFWFYINNNCKPESTRLVFLNNRGGYDYYTFTAYREDTKKIERQSYDNRYFSENITSPDRDFGRTLKTFDTQVTKEVVLDTEYLSVPYANWLEQLFYSPQVYEMKPDFISPIDKQDKVYKDLRPIQILSTTVETITKKHKKLNKYRITFSYATPFFVNSGF